MDTIEIIKENSMYYIKNNVDEICNMIHASSMIKHNSLVCCIPDFALRHMTENLTKHGFSVKIFDTAITITKYGIFIDIRDLENITITDNKKVITYKANDVGSIEKITNMYDETIYETLSGNTASEEIEKYIDNCMEYGLSKSCNITSKYKNQQEYMIFDTAKVYIDARGGYKADPNSPMKKAINLINDYCAEEFSSEADITDLNRIEIAYTNDEDTDIPIQTYVDLINFRLVKEYGGQQVHEETFSSLEHMTENLLECLDFNELVDLNDDEKAIVETALDGR